MKISLKHVFCKHSWKIEKVYPKDPTTGKFMKSYSVTACTRCGKKKA